MEPHDAVAGQLAITLQDRLERVTLPLSADVRASLRTDVLRYTEELQACGFAPERVIVALKQIAEQAGFREASGPSAQSVDGRNDRDKFLTDLVAWCIDGYYQLPRRAD